MVAIAVAILVTPDLVVVLTPCGAALERHSATGSFFGDERLVNSAQLVHLVDRGSVVGVFLDQGLRGPTKLSIISAEKRNFQSLLRSD